MSGVDETATARDRGLAGVARSSGWRAFPGKPQYVREARVYIASHVADWPEDERHWVEVCASELTANALLHTRSGLCVGDRPGDESSARQGWFGIRVVRDLHAVRVEVADCGVPARAQRPSAADEGGLGLDRIVANLATDWGYHETPSGRVTWFEYALEGVAGEVAPVGNGTRRSGRDR